MRTCFHANKQSIYGNYGYRETGKTAISERNHRYDSIQIEKTFSNIAQHEII